jgi:hypothetical protein
VGVPTTVEAPTTSGIENQHTRILTVEGVPMEKSSNKQQATVPMVEGEEEHQQVAGIVRELGASARE